MRLELKIQSNTLLCFALLLPFFEPQYFKQISYLSSIYDMIEILVFCYCALLAVMNLKRIPSAIYLVLILQLLFFIITFYRGQNITSAKNALLSIGGIALILFVYLDDIDTLLKCLLIHFELCIYLNFASLVLTSNGLYSISSYYGTSPGYFLGYHHLFLTWFFPGIIVAWICKEKYGYRYRCYLLSAVIVLSELMFGINSTGFIGILLFLLCMIFPNLVKKIGGAKLIGISVVIVVLVVFMRFTDFLEPIMLGILGESDMTFTGRTVIWDSAIRAFLKEPVIGYGVPYTDFITNILANGGGYASHCHNHILQILFQGGLVAFALFVSIFVKNIHICMKNWSDQVFRICLIGIAVFIIIGMTEPFEYGLMYLVVLMPTVIYWGSNCLDTEISDIDSLV